MKFLCLSDKQILICIVQNKKKKKKLIITLNSNFGLNNFFLQSFEDKKNH